MKKYIFILLTIILVSCSDNKTVNTYSTKTDSGLSTIIIDSCEYINGFNRLAHKGNCKFCKERREKEILDCYD